MALMFPSKTARAAVRSSSGAWARIAIEAPSRASTSSRRMNLLRSEKCTLAKAQLKEGKQAMKIGVISDTHGLVRPEAIAALIGADKALRVRMNQVSRR